jgi:hypothetical protein
MRCQTREMMGLLNKGFAPSPPRVDKAVLKKSERPASRQLKREAEEFGRGNVTQRCRVNRPIQHDCAAIMDAWRCMFRYRHAAEVLREGFGDDSTRDASQRH